MIKHLWKKCSDCNGYGNIICDGRLVKCKTCNGFGWIEMPMTNADRIREMSDEELAEFICDVYKDGCRDELSNTIKDATVDGLTQWLQEEYKENV